MYLVNSNPEEKDQNKIIGENIKALRILMGFTQDHLASVLGITRTMISYFENGEREISMPQLMKLSDLFCVDLSELIEENKASRELNSAVAFKRNSLESIDLEAIADFRKIVKNYIQLKK